MADLILGPILRRVEDGAATIWMETDGPCAVEILDEKCRTFTVAGHHYALLIVEGLEPGNLYPYDVRLDGEKVWPNRPGWGSSIRVPDPNERRRIVFGSCRAAAPHEPPFTLDRSRHPMARGVDSLRAYAIRMREQPREEWPDVLLMLGDQVYVDEMFPATRAFIGERRSIDEPPGDEVLDLEEYAQLYRETWGDAEVRWMMANVSTSMIFDDHDISDDWNISETWVRDMRALPWWSSRIESGLMTYWIYQHAGNLSPDDLRSSALYKGLLAADDGEDLLRDFARQADVGISGTEEARWSYARDIGRMRLLVVDSRAGRVLEDARRSMLDEREWSWVEQQCHGDFEHLMIATSLPFLLPRGIHDFEAWNEALCAGAWGAWAKGWSERLRRAIDLEHWAAFQDSFRRMARLIADVGAGRKGAPPKSITLLSGDVHYSYLARANYGDDVVSPVHQAVCSPVRNPVPPAIERGFRFGISRAAGVAGKILASAARVEKHDLTWGLCQGPWFHNGIATIDADRGSAIIRFERAAPGDYDDPLELVYAGDLCEV